MKLTATVLVALAVFVTALPAKPDQSSGDGVDQCVCVRQTNVDIDALLADFTLGLEFPNFPQSTTCGKVVDRSEFGFSVRPNAIPVPASHRGYDSNKVCGAEYTQIQRSHSVTVTGFSNNLLGGANVQGFPGCACEAASQYLGRCEQQPWWDENGLYNWPWGGQVWGNDFTFGDENVGNDGNINPDFQAPVITDEWLGNNQFTYKRHNNGEHQLVLNKRNVLFWSSSENSVSSGTGHDLAWGPTDGHRLVDCQTRSQCKGQETERGIVEHKHHQGYWLNNESDVWPYVIFDLWEPHVVTGFDLFNTFNSPWHDGVKYDRGTGDFMIWGANQLALNDDDDAFPLLLNQKLLVSSRLNAVVPPEGFPRRWKDLDAKEFVTPAQHFVSQDQGEAYRYIMFQPVLNSYPACANVDKGCPPDLSEHGWEAFLPGYSRRYGLNEFRIFVANRHHSEHLRSAVANACFHSGSADDTQRDHSAAFDSFYESAEYLLSHTTTYNPLPWGTGLNEPEFIRYEQLSSAEGQATGTAPETTTTSVAAPAVQHAVTLSTPAIIGIVVGAVMALAIILSVTVLKLAAIRRKKRSKSSKRVSRSKKGSVQHDMV